MSDDDLEIIGELSIDRPFVDLLAAASSQSLFHGDEQVDGFSGFPTFEHSDFEFLVYELLD